MDQEFGDRRLLHEAESSAEVFEDRPLCSLSRRTSRFRAAGRRPNPLSELSLEKKCAIFDAREGLRGTLRSSGRLHFAPSRGRASTELHPIREGGSGFLLGGRGPSRLFVSTGGFRPGNGRSPNFAIRDS